MANNKTDYLEGKIIEHVCRNVAYTSPAAVYVGLFTAAPGETGGGTEVTGNAYARQACGFGAHSGGTVTNAADIVFPVATPAGWGTITDFAIFDNSTGGNMLYYGTLTASQTVAAGQQFKFAAGQLSVQEL